MCASIQTLPFNPDRSATPIDPSAYIWAVGPADRTAARRLGARGGLREALVSKTLGVGPLLGCCTLSIASVRQRLGYVLVEASSLDPDSIPRSTHAPPRSRTDPAHPTLPTHLTIDGRCRRGCRRLGRCGRGRLRHGVVGGQHSGQRAERDRP